MTRPAPRVGLGNAWEPEPSKSDCRRRVSGTQGLGASPVSGQAGSNRDEDLVQPTNLNLDGSRLTTSFDAGPVPRVIRIAKARQHRAFPLADNNRHRARRLADRRLHAESGALFTQIEKKNEFVISQLHVEFDDPDQRHDAHSTYSQKLWGPNVISLSDYRGDRRAA